ncbi:MAG: DUF1294 domain-containing protein [Clostridia bacterium]|nr:DUF1294 domain-containing protein [Clostridia bacterium]
MIDKYWIIAFFIAWNLVVMIVYGIDKLKAKKGAWRIPEKTLIGLALLMGATGALLGMKFFRHKTKHKLFTIGVPVCFVINVLVIVGIIYLGSKA